MTFLEKLTSCFRGSSSPKTTQTAQPKIETQNNTSKGEGKSSSFSFSSLFSCFKVFKFNFKFPSFHFACFKRSPSKETPKGPPYTACESSKNNVYKLNKKETPLTETHENEVLSSSSSVSVTLSSKDKSSDESEPPLEKETRTDIEKLLDDKKIIEILETGGKEKEIENKVIGYLLSRDVDVDLDKLNVNDLIQAFKNKKASPLPKREFPADPEGDFNAVKEDEKSNIMMIHHRFTSDYSLDQVMNNTFSVMSPQSEKNLIKELKGILENESLKLPAKETRIMKLLGEQVDTYGGLIDSGFEPKKGIFEWLGKDWVFYLLQEGVFPLDWIESLPKEFLEDFKGREGFNDLSEFEKNKIVSLTVSVSVYYTSNDFRGHLSKER